MHLAMTAWISALLLFCSCQSGRIILGV